MIVVSDWVINSIAKSFYFMGQSHYKEETLFRKQELFLNIHEKDYLKRTILEKKGFIFQKLLTTWMLCSIVRL